MSLALSSRSTALSPMRSTVASARHGRNVARSTVRMTQRASRVMSIEVVVDWVNGAPLIVRSRMSMSLSHSIRDLGRALVCGSHREARPRYDWKPPTSSRRSDATSDPRRRPPSDCCEIATARRSRQSPAMPPSPSTPSTRCLPASPASFERSTGERRATQGATPAEKRSVASPPRSQSP